MAGKIYLYLARDHDRLDAALKRAAADSNGIDAAAYAEFRESLLRHISMEEKILFPSVRAANDGAPPALAARLHLDHGALAALLVPTPTHSIINALRTVLERHNPLEEGRGGVYEECEHLLGGNASEILVRLQNAPRVAVAEHVDSALSMESARKALRRAGYDIPL